MATGGFRNIPIPKPLSLTGNVGQNWKIFRRDFNNYEIATKLNTETMDIRVATLLSCIGSDAMNVFDGLKLTDEQRKQIPDILTAFERYCIGETNETYERFIFNSRNQVEGETIEKYVAELRKLSRSCNFSNLEEDLIRDRIVMGVRCDITRRKLLQEPNLTLSKATDIARAMEVSKGQMSRIKKEEETDELVQKLRSSNFPPKKSAKNCHFCNKNHPFKKEQCPAYGKTCSACRGRNHFAGSKYCRSDVKLVTESIDYKQDQSDFEDYTWLTAVGNGKPRATATLSTNDQNIKFQLDTGSDVNTICQRYVRKEQLRKTGQRLTMWNKTKLEPIGEVDLETLNPRTGTTHWITYTVVPNSLSCLLGMETLKALGFITLNEGKFIAKVDSNCALGESKIAINNHPTLGDLGEAHLHIDRSKKPRQLPCRRVPFALQDKVKTQISSLVERGVLALETEPTEWVSQMALAEKSNGDIRICIDPAPLNEALMREHYKLPTLDDVLCHLNGARLFTKVDVKEAYWHVRLDEESSKLTTMITPFGRFRWLRLPFGLKVSSEIFQRKITEALDGLVDTTNVADDIVVAGRGKDEEEARASLRHNSQQLKQRCKERRILLNDTKEIAEEPEITFMGHLLTANGISPDPAKVTAIKNMPAPTDVSAVRRLCGTVQYLARFIPNLADNLEPLRALTKKNADWNWTAECQQAFEKIKNLITEDAKLAYFDINKELFLQVDSSKSGVGCFLHQDGRPIEYASKTLTDTQRRWAQIEKELLSVVIGLERFDQYTYGRKVIVENDHKPLEQIIKKPLSQVPRRLQNLLMRLHRYNIKFKYIEGSKLHVADTLSRAVAGNEAHDIPDLQIHIVSGVSDLMMGRFREATKTDEILQKLADYIQDGWPEELSHTSPVMVFKQVKDSLSIEDGILYKGEQVIVPRALRAEVKQKLHAAHLGYDSMIRRARDAVYWPGMYHEIKQLADTCDSCQIRKPANQKEKLQQHEEGNKPWMKVGIDFFEIREHNYIVIVDYFSTYIEVEYLKSTTSTQTINTLKKTFARWGIPQELVSDNGPQLVSGEFKDFLKSWGITHKPSDPLYPKGNGKAEAAVKTIKNMLQKCHERNEDPYMALLELRATPRQDTGMSPAKILLGRQPRTCIPTKDKTTIQNPEYQNLRQKRRESVKRCYDKGATTLEVIPTQSPVFYKSAQDKWCPGKVTGRNGRKYHILGENGGEYIRNRFHIRPKATPFDETFEAVMTTPRDQDTSQPDTTGRTTRERRAPLWHKDYVKF